jgi:hypothetical protein
MITDCQVRDERTTTQYVTEEAIYFFNKYFKEHCIMTSLNWNVIKDDFYKYLMKDFIELSKEK